MRIVAMLMIATFGLCPASAETVQVLGRGPVDLQHFVCEEAPHSAIRRVCYDEENQYLVIQLGSLYLHYCAIEPQKVYGLLHAKSVARYFNAEIKGRYICNSQTAPAYN